MNNSKITNTSLSRVAFFLFVNVIALNAQEDPLKIEENGDVKIQKLEVIESAQISEIHSPFAHLGQIENVYNASIVNTKTESLSIGSWLIKEVDGNLIFKKGNTSFYLTQNGIRQNLDLRIGDLHEGGIIIYLDESGQHGLVISEHDLGQAKWGPREILTDAKNSGIYGGKLNTKTMIEAFGDVGGVGSSARLCTQYNGGGFSDWYLPSDKELQFAWENVLKFLKFDKARNWWSSTEYNKDLANSLSTYTRKIEKGKTSKSDPWYYVRAVRSF